MVRKLDTITSLIVRARDKRCHCGTRENLTCGHLFTRSNYSTRWDLMNCNAQCLSDNLKHEYNPYPYQEWWKRTYGEAAYHDLYKKWARTTEHHWSDLELKILLDELTSYYNESIQSGNFETFVSSLSF